MLAESVQELDITLAGDKKTPLTLTFERVRLDGTRVTLERRLKRERLDEETAVPVASMLDAGTGYVRITTFAHVTAAEDLHDALGRLEKAGMTRLVLDIRDNPGGYVRQAARVAGEFLPEGAIVYTTEGRKAEIRKDTGRVNRSFFRSEKRYPIVLLVNGGSASASELLAGALQDHDRALIAGRPTHGKALMMLVLPVMDGASYVNSWVYLNVGRVRTPCGRVIQRSYRNITRREYYRRAGHEADTTGRPSCTTAGGRRVYGGGGVFPDVVLPEAQPRPLWLAQALERGLGLTWVGAHVSAEGAAYTSLDALVRSPVVAGSGLAAFRKLAAERAVTIPAGEEADRLLTRVLLGLVADAKWGDAGLYRIEAALDPEIRAAAELFERARGVLGARR